MTHALTLFVALAGASQAGELVLPAFETPLRELRGQIMATHDATVRAKSSMDLERLASDVRSMQWTAQRLRFDISDIRRRAQRYDPRNPNSDPFLRSDLSRVIWSLRDLAWAAQRVRMDADRLAMNAKPDPELVGSARRFVDSFTWTENEMTWVLNEARWAEWDVRRAGFSMEAWDLTRYSGDADRDVRDAHRDADQILRKVSEPVPQPPQNPQ